MLTFYSGGKNYLIIWRVTSINYNEINSINQNIHRFAAYMCVRVCSTLELQRWTRIHNNVWNSFLRCGNADAHHKNVYRVQHVQTAKYSVYVCIIPYKCALITPTHTNA